MALNIIYIFIAYFLFESSFCLQGCNQTIEAIQGSTKLGIDRFIKFAYYKLSLYCNDLMH